MRKTSLFILSILFCTSIMAQESRCSIQQHIEKLIDSSNIYYNEGNYSKSLQTNISIIEKASRIKDTFFLQKGYRFLGYDYLFLNDTIRAKASFEKAQKFASNFKNKEALGKNYMDLANVYGASSRTMDKAITYHNKSIDIFARLNDTLNLGAAYFNTIFNLHKVGRFSESLPYLIKIDSIKKPLTSTLKAGILNKWGEYHYHFKGYKKADYYLSSLIKDTLLHTSRVKLARAYDLYGKSLYAQGLHKEAFDNQAIYQQLFEDNLDKLQNEESQKAAARFQVAEYKENIEKTELKNRLQAEIVKSQKNWNKLLIVFTTLSVLLVLVLYTTYRTKKEYVKNLTQKNHEYLAAKNESEELSKAKTAFFSTVSHELRTPLYGVIGLSTILMDSPKLESHQQDLKSLKFSADYLLALINDVLQINKLDSHNIEETLDNFNIEEFIKNIASSFQYMCQQNLNKMYINIDDNVPSVIKGDVTKLSQILMNLIGNACKFTENGDIHILLEASNVTDDQANIHFTIQDTGIGIPKEKQLSIFDEFAQVTSRNYTHQGTGLGLPIVKKLLALYNTEIHLSSEEGKGSTFYFSLNFQLPAYGEEILTKPTIIIDDKSFKNKEILIVDDNRINQIVTTKILEKLGVICSIANNGQEAIDRTKEKSFDLILMDINMPIKDGLEATKEIRIYDENTPIIALTAVEVKEMRYKIYNAGLTDIIVKPYDISIFKRTILQNLKINLELPPHQLQA